MKHLPTPVRLFRIGPCGPVPVLTGRIAVGTMLPTVAVIPFSGLGIEREHRILGEILADDVIHALSRTAELNVISRLSTTAFRDRPFPLDELASRLGAHYVLTGAYSVQGTALTLRVQLVDTASSLVVWSGRLHDAIGDLLAHEDSLTSEVVRRVGQTIMSREVERVRQAPLPTLDSYSLLLGAVGLLHRLSRRDFNDSRTLLEALIERARRQPLPHAWLAKWYVMQVQQGWSENPARDAELAHDCTKAALDADPDSSLALAMDGLVHTNLLRQLDVAGEQYARALELNPNDAQAWLLRGTMHAFKGEGTLAVEATERALTLSPYDPHKHYYDSLAATAQLAARRYDKALELARRSYRANRAHTSTLRVMASAQWKLGQRKAAIIESPQEKKSDIKDR